MDSFQDDAKLAARLSPSRVRRLSAKAITVAAAVSVSLLAFQSAAIAADAAATANEGLEEVVITGSSIKGLDIQTALPVSIVSRAQIEKSGVSNMEQLMAQVSATATAGATKTSDTAGLASYGLSSISLRGLGDNRTLVLVDGHRVASLPNGGTTASVDINSIPLAAIERVEVLRDGASASYGSDAVAGVVNFILRKNFDGMQVSADVGQPTRSGHGGTVDRYNLVLGSSKFADGKISIMAGGDWELSTPLFARDRNFSKSGNVSPYFASAATPSGRIEGIWIPGQTKQQNSRDPATNPFGYASSGYGNPAYPDCASINMYPVAKKGGVGGKYNNCNFDSASFVSLFPKDLHTDAFANMKAELSSSMNFHLSANYSRNAVTEAYQPSPVRVAFLSTDLAFTGSGVDPALLIYPTNPNYQSIVVPYLTAMNATVPGILAAMNGKPLAVSARTFLTGPRTEVDTNTQTRFTAGIDGSVASMGHSWDYDVTATYGEAKTAGRVIDGYFSQLGLARVLNNPASNWNPWAPAGKQADALTAQLQSAKYIGPTIGGSSNLTTLDATTSTKLIEMTGGPMQMALGASFRRETYIVTVPDILGTGDIAGLGGATLPESSQRDVKAFYTEFNLPWTKEFSTNISGRYDNYTLVGGSASGKLSARWQPIEQLLLRGSFGTGFRAPTLVELFLPQSIGSTEQFIDPANAADGPVQPNAILAGNSKLKPEKSNQFSVGFGFSPIRDLTLSVDYFHIKIDDYIIKPAALGLVAAAEAGKPLYGPRDVLFSDGSYTFVAGTGQTVDTIDQTLRNAASAKVEGLDVSFDWSHTFTFGKLGVNLAGTKMLTYDLTTLAGVQKSVGTIVQPDGSPLDIAGLGVVTSWKHVLSLDWSLGSWGATLTQNYYAGYQDANDLNGNRHDVGAQTILDAQITFSGVRNLTLALGARNLTDKDPPIFIGNGASFQFGYDPTIYDPRGRFVYLRATYKVF